MMVSTLPTEAPPGWGDDLLTQYLDDYRGNQYASFHGLPVTKTLIKLDALFFKVCNGAINPRPRVPMLFLLRAHSAYRAAVGAVMAGQVYEAIALVRTILELSAYGAYIGDNADRFELWCNRHDTKASKEAVRDEFSQGKLKAHMRSMSGPLAADYVTLYEWTIDMGAHPNERGFFANMNVTKGDGQQEFEQVYLQGNGKQLEFGTDLVRKVGQWCLLFHQMIWPAKFELLGIREELEAMRNAKNPPQGILLPQKA